MNTVNNKPHEIPQVVRDLCPNLNEEQLQEATDNLIGYLNVAVRIFERTQAEAEASLTEPRKDGTVVL